MKPDSGDQDILSATIEELLSQKLTVSSITKVEIISVLGKYARGNQGGIQKCNCMISQDGRYWGGGLNYSVLRLNLLMRILFRRLKRL